MATMYEVKTYNALVQDMITWILANQDRITDFNEGSVGLSFIEAYARVMARLYARGLSGFENYNQQLPARVFGFQLKLGQRSAGSVTFGVDSPAASALTIPSGTLLTTTPSGNLYETTEDGTIAIGELASTAVAVQARDIGSSFDLSAGRLNNILDPVDVDTVTNALPVSGGQDQESTEAYLQRFQEYILGLGQASVPGQLRVAREVEGVNSASLTEHFPPLAGYFNTTIYIEDGGGTAPTALIESVQLAIDGNSTTIAGTRGSGTRVRVQSSTVLPTDITVDILGAAGLDISVIDFLVREEISSYMSNLRIGETFRLNVLLGRIVTIAEVSDVVTITPDSNIEPDSNQIIRPGTIMINITFPS